MKSGYKKLITFEIIICTIVLLNSFVSNILSRYIFILFLLLTAIIFKKIFGMEKDKHRYIKDIILETIIFLIIFFIFFYLFGIIIGFARVGNYYNLNGIITFILPIILTVILTEVLRYMTTCKAEGNKLATAMTIITLVIIEISSAIYYRQFSTNYEIFLFLALTLLPALSTNISFNYITKKVGYKPLILYSLIIKLYYYLLPIVPNPNEYITSIISFTLPILYFYRIYIFMNKDKSRIVERNYKEKRIIPLIPTIIITIILVYLTSGYFHYWAIAVASGSMSPVIKKGDVAIIEKIGKKYDDLKEEDIIAFKYKKVIVVHRLIRIIEEKGHYYFYTKGDANQKEDNFVIKESMIIGIVNKRIPYIGKPTVWLNEL